MSGKSQFDPAQYGFVLDDRVMEHGDERRIRLRCPVNEEEGGEGRARGAYIFTEAGTKPSWQNAHAHKGLRETFIVQEGWIAFAEVTSDGDYTIRVCWENEVFTSRPGIPHNVYMPLDAMIHTVQHGQPIGNPDKKGNDWYPAPELDEWTKKITFWRIAEIASQIF